MSGQQTSPPLTERPPIAIEGSRRAEAGLYALAAVLYIGLGVMARTVVLNWIVGPLFPFLVVYFVPRRIRLWRARRSSRRAAS